jgi:hypothetical protein
MAAAMLALIMLPVNPVSGHPLSDHDQIMYTLHRCADGVTNRDPHAIAPLLHDDFTALPPGRLGPRTTKESFLEQLVADGAFDGIPITLRYAFLDMNREKTEATVQPVVTYRLGNPAALAVELVKLGDDWQIIRITLDADLPPELVEDLPEHHTLQRVSVQVSDKKTGRPVRARVNLRDSDGRYWPPDGHMRDIPTGIRQDVGGDVRVAGTTYAYVEPEFTLSVPIGSYELEVHHGLEYLPEKIRFDVTHGKAGDLEVRLERWSDIRKRGWYSGDTHTHFLDPKTGMLEMRAEDLDVLNILATKWGELITNVEHFTGVPSPLSTPDHIVYVGGENRHSFLGHTILLGINRLVYPLSWGGPPPGVPGGHDYPPMAKLADGAHAQGGFVSWAHFPFPSGELAVDVALEKIDSIDLMTWGDAFAEEGRSGEGAVKMWYRFLNCGFRIPATAGTDKMFNTQVIGSVRTYVKPSGDFSYSAWLAGIRAGRTFVTTGPILELVADGREPGDTIAARGGDTIRIRTQVESRLPVDWIEVVMGGKVVARKNNESGAASLALGAELTVSQSTWVAARAYSASLQPYQISPVLGRPGIPLMAHTSPIYINVDGKPPRSPEDAEVLMRETDRAIEWARTNAVYLDELQRQEVIALYQRARKVYLEQMNEQAVEH